MTGASETDLSALIAELDPDAASDWRNTSRAKRVKIGRATEADITRLLCQGVGPLGQATISALARAAQVSVDTSAWRLSTWSRLRALYPGSYRPGGPDIVVVDESAVPRIVVEAKFNADVNGGKNYCLEHAVQEGYSNQAICYLHACGVAEPLAGFVRDASFVWLSRAADQGVHGPWGRHGALPSWDEEAPELARYARQLSAAQQWHPLTWGALCEAVAVVSTGGLVLADVISRRARGGHPWDGDGQF